MTSHPNLPDATRVVRERHLVDGDAKVPILDVSFSDLSSEEAVERIAELIDAHEAAHVVLANAHTLNYACMSDSYRRVIQGATLVLRDGIGIELASLLSGRRLRENFVGTDFVPGFLEKLEDRELSVFLFGGRPGVAEDAARMLTRRMPKLRIVGTADGYEDADQVVERVGAARPDVLLVALGNPLQEQWIAANRDKLDCGVALGVGALFDYLGGGVQRAPRWLRLLRSEWLFRLLVEPRRLWRRYVLGNPLFVYRVLTSPQRPGRRVTDPAGH